MKHAACLTIHNRRPEKSRRLLEKIKEAEFNGTLYLFCDGPKEGWSDEEKENHKKVVEILEKAVKEIPKSRISILDTNLGPQLGPVHGIGWILSEQLQASILEDDIIPHPEFFNIHAKALKEYRDHPALWLAEGHPLKDCPVPWLETRMARLVAWSTWREKALPIFANINPPFPWRGAKREILAGLHPKTAIHLYKEFERLEREPRRWWHYPILQQQLLLGKTGLTPTARLHHNTGIDGTGGNCLNLLGATEQWNNNEVEVFLKKSGSARLPQWERKMEIERYGRVRQAIARKLYALTPKRWKHLWKPTLKTD